MVSPLNSSFFQYFFFLFSFPKIHITVSGRKWPGFSAPSGRLLFNAAFDEGGSQRLRLMEALTAGGSGNDAGRAEAPPFSMNFVLKRVAFFTTEATEIKCDRAERK